MSRYPPVHPRLRPWVIGLRIMGIVLLVSGAVVGTAFLQNGDTAAGVALLIGAISFATGAWMSLYSPFSVVLLAVPLLVAPIVGIGGLFPPVIALVFLGAFFWARRRPVRLDPQGVRRTEDEAVMPHAVPFVAEFEQLGWSRAGAVSADLGSMVIVISVLLSPEKESFAEVTDVVITITSMFHDGRRSLVTRNSGAAPLREVVLGNDLRGASPAELVQGHQAALQLVSDEGAAPDRLSPDTVVDLVIEQERLATEHASGFRPSLFGTLTGEGPLDRSQSSRERIRAWLS